MDQIKNLLCPLDRKFPEIFKTHPSFITVALLRKERGVENPSKEVDKSTIQMELTLLSEVTYVEYGASRRSCWAQMLTVQQYSGLLLGGGELDEHMVTLSIFLLSPPSLPDM